MVASSPVELDSAAPAGVALLGHRKSRDPRLDHAAVQLPGQMRLEHAIRQITGLALCVLLFWATLAVAKRHRNATKDTSGGQFDFYVLSLSWAPNFCASHAKDKSNECKSGRHIGFVLHGLWPEAESGRQPESCQAAPPVAQRTVTHMLQFYPTRGLVQHEWQKHGTCSGLSAADYFDRAEQALTSIKLPEKYTAASRDSQPSIQDLEKAFASANHAPENSFRVSCHGGELVGVEACLTKDLTYRACGPSVRECSSGNVLMRPPR